MIIMNKHKIKTFIAAVPVLVWMSLPASAQEIKVIKFNELQQLRQLPHDTLYIVNFWATWCVPCVKELPYFEAASKQHKDQPVRVVLVSMDAAPDLEKRVKPFVQKHKITSEVMLLDEVDGNTWIDKIEPKWSGAIPATMLFNNKRNQYQFMEREMKEEELQQLISELKPKS